MEMICKELSGFYFFFLSIVKISLKSYATDGATLPVVDFTCSKRSSAGNWRALLAQAVGNSQLAPHGPE